MPKLTILPGDVRQTIAGFGASGCWWAKDVGGWQAEKVDAIVDMLYGREKGIGLNIYRFEVGGGEVNPSADAWRRAETFEVSPGRYDWGRDANSMSVLRKAVAAGADNVMFFANTPPGRMTVSGRTTGADEGEPNLRPGMEGEFARYLTDIALHFREEGIPVKYISPINEPQWRWQDANGQEGCHYEPDQIVAVAEALTKELAARGAGMRPSLVDSGTWRDETYTVGLCGRLAANPVVGPAMDHYAVHSYWADAEARAETVAMLAGADVTTPLWQTEWCQMQGGRDLGMDAALVLAECVHNDMTITACPAWIAWIAVSCYDFKDGLVYVDLDSRSVTDSRRMWALGNYSRFVREGYRRVGTAGDAGSLMVSAYVSPAGDTLTLVCVNADGAERTLDIEAEGFTHFEAYETSDAHALEKVASDRVGVYAFPARSVTTLVIRK